MKEGFRQSMAWLHTWAGLVLGWVLFFMFLTGTAGYSDTEIDRWMRPELPPVTQRVPAPQVLAVALTRLQEQAPQAERWFITLPGDRNNPWLRIFWQLPKQEEGASALNGNEQLDLAMGMPPDARTTGGGQLLYQMYWRLHYLPAWFTDWLIGICTMFMLVAIVTGIIVHKKIFVDFLLFVRARASDHGWMRITC
jgi:uncharacterized iron-regulated membrane protein